MSATSEDLIQRRLEGGAGATRSRSASRRWSASRTRGPSSDPSPRRSAAHTTLLFGGLTWKHEKLVHGALEGLGYLAEVLPSPT